MNTKQSVAVEDGSLIPNDETSTDQCPQKSNQMVNRTAWGKMAMEAVCSHCGHEMYIRPLD